MHDTVAIQTAENVLLLLGILLAAGSVCAYLARRVGVPDIVLYLLAGMLLGPHATGLVSLAAGSALNQLILIFGASYILFDGGATLRFEVLNRIWITIVVLATVGVLITAFVTAGAAHYLLGLPPLTAMLLGALLSATDPATLVPVFRQVRVRERLAQTVMSESAFNDAVAAILTFTLLGLVIGGGGFSWSGSLLDFLKQAGIGLVAGTILGYVAAFLIGHEKYSFLREHAPLVTLMAVVGAYLGAENLHASGFMAVFVAGVILGNGRTFGFRLSDAERQRMVEYVETTALVMRMAIFLLLGAQVDFANLGTHLWGGVAVVAVFMLVARPLTVYLCAAPDRRARWTRQELLFMCWTRETGVIPGALAGMLLGLGVPGAETIAAVAFLAILITILVQATTTRWLASRLDVLEPQT